MSVVVIGLNHRSVPLDLFERLTIAPADLPKALAEVASREHVSEAVVLSTCNRTEFYVFAERFHGAFADVRNSLATLSAVAPEDFSHQLYVFDDADAVGHLFAVASGLDSAVIGESEVQGQVRDAWELAQAEGTIGTSLNNVFRHAVEVGKRARTETAISRNITSVSQAAVAMASQHLGSLADRSILVLGAGEMGEGMASALAGAGAAEIVVTNRTVDRARDLADRIGGRAIPLDELPVALTEADLLLTSTGASSLLVEHGALRDVMDDRQGRPLLVVDIAVPRDVAPTAADIPGVTLLDMHDLTVFAEAGREERHKEIDKVRRIIDEEVDRYIAATTAREVAPLVRSLRDRAEEIRAAEFERFSRRMTGLSDDDRNAVDALTRRLLGKLLHDPTVRLKDAAGTPRGDRLAEALRDLYQL